MNPRQAQLFLVAQAEYVRALGMVAENQQRQVLGHSMAYNENDFSGAAARIDDLALELINS